MIKIKAAANLQKMRLVAAWVLLEFKCVLGSSFGFDKNSASCKANSFYCAGTQDVLLFWCCCFEYEWLPT